MTHNLINILADEHRETKSNSMKHFKGLVSAIIFLIFCQYSFAQATSTKDAPEIGKAVPAFELTNMGNFSKPKMASRSFKGRFLIIDFWNKNCISCVQSFPKLNKLHKQYKEKLDLILVGTDEKGIQEMFNNFREKQNLEFPYAFNMSMYKTYVTGGAPHIVWIDDKGLIQAISSGGDLNEANIQSFLQGKKFDFHDLSHGAIAKQEAAYDLSKPFLVNGNGSDEYNSKFRYRSLISEYIPGTPFKSWPDYNLWRQRYSTGTPDGKRRIFEVCSDLKELYTVAYTGWVQWGFGDKPYLDTYGGIVLNLTDSSMFETDKVNSSGIYWYSLIMPSERVTPAYVMKSMQNDLERYFGFRAVMETRKFPALKITAIDKAKALITKGGKTEKKGDHSMYSGTNVPLSDFFNSALSYHANFWENKNIPVIIDETGFTENVDINVKMNDGDWNDVQRVLKELGFELVPAEKELKVLVISDIPKSSNNL